MTPTYRSERRPVVTEALRHALGRLEDDAAATGWVWNAALSGRVDALCVWIEDRRG